jgi:hypothetical protein
MAPVWLNGFCAHQITLNSQVQELKKTSISSGYLDVLTAMTRLDHEYQVHLKLVSNTCGKQVLTVANTHFAILALGASIDFVM